MIHPRTGLASMCCATALLLGVRVSATELAPTMRTVRRSGTTFRVPAEWRELDGLAREIEQNFLRSGHGAPLLASVFGDRSAGIFVVLFVVVARPEVQDTKEVQSVFAKALRASITSSGAKLVRFEGETGDTGFVARSHGSVVHSRTVASVDNDGILHLFALQCVRARKQLKALDALCLKVLASFVPLANADPSFRLDGGKDAGPLRVPASAGDSQPPPLPTERGRDQLGLFLLAGGGILLLLAVGMYLLRRQGRS